MKRNATDTLTAAPTLAGTIANADHQLLDVIRLNHAIVTMAIGLIELPGANTNLNEEAICCVAMRARDEAEKVRSELEDALRKYHRTKP